MPTQMAWRRTIPDEGGGVDGKRWLRNAVAGSAVPVSPSTAVKKNAQRAPPLGMVYKMTALSPPQPNSIKTNAAGRKLFTGGESSAVGVSCFLVCVVDISIKLYLITGVRGMSSGEIG